MTLKSVREMTRLERWRHSLSHRTFIAILIVTLTISLASAAVGAFLYFSTVYRQYRVSTWQMSSTAAQVLDNEIIKSLSEEVLDIYDSAAPEAAAEQTEDYLASFNTIGGADFESIRDELRDIQEQNGAIASYIAALDVKKARMVFIADSDLKSSYCPPGYWDQFTDEQIGIFINSSGTGPFDELHNIDPLPALVAHYEKYGYRCTAGTYIGDVNGYPVFIFYDTDMNDIYRMSLSFIIRFIIILAVFATVIGVIYSHYLRKNVVKPILELTDAASAYMSDRNDEARDAGHFNALDIHTGDEIENLSLTMKDMERELADYIHNLSRVTAEKERLSTELDIASQIQEGMLPSIFPPYPEKTELDIYAIMEPAKEVGGDFYDFFLIDDDHLAIVIADVSGKGVPAALFMMSCQILIKNYVTMVTSSPAKVLEKVNHQLCMTNDVEMFVTAWLGVLEISTGTLRAANAGHEYPALRRKDGNFELYKDEHGFVLGGFDGVRYKEYEIRLNAGDTIFVYTDGVPEATGSSGDMLGTDRMIECLDRCSGNVMQSIYEMHKYVLEFTGNAPQFDDITMMALTYIGNPASKLTVQADISNLHTVTEFVVSELEKAGCSMKSCMQTEIAVEEIFTNICNYAYAPETGDAVIGVRAIPDENSVEISFCDRGMPYNPLEAEEPDLDLPPEDKEIGGLGIYMTRKFMDQLDYEYRDGQNRLKIYKKLDSGI